MVYRHFVNIIIRKLNKMKNLNIEDREAAEFIKNIFLSWLDKNKEGLTQCTTTERLAKAFSAGFVWGGVCATKAHNDAAEKLNVKNST